MKYTKNESEVPIEDFIVCWMCAMRIRKRLYRVSHNQLYIEKYLIRGKLIIVLKELYPQYNYYWKTPRILKWF